MSRVGLSIVLTFLLLTPLSPSADETISFKGIKFGMKAEEVAKLGGGNTKQGCHSAIQNETLFSLYGGNQPWTYGGIDRWYAICIESYDEAKRIPGISGLIEISALVGNHKNGFYKFIGNNTYSVEELVEIFSEVFGKFDIETKVVTMELGQEFEKKSAIAIRGGAVMTIADSLYGELHEEYIRLKIVNLVYLTKEGALEMEKASDKMKKASDKMKDAKSDF